MSTLSQLQFPGMGRNLPSFSVQGTNPKHEAPAYTSAHDPDGPVGSSRRDWVKNALPHSNRILPPHYGPEQEEWVPTERLTSNQTGVNPKAIDHQVKNANPLALESNPYTYAYQADDGKESYLVGDGNHRANAALRRGQLLIPADVRRPITGDVRNIL